MKFISLKELAISPLTVELYVNLDNKLCVSCKDEFTVLDFEIVEFDGESGVDLDSH